MKTTLFESKMLLPRGRSEVFPYFASAENLETLTPPWLRFRITTPCPVAMRKGCRIDYKLRIRGLPVRWQAEITAWDPPCRFVDEQRRGPYRSWVHEHLFEEHPSGTLVIDRVHYSVFGGRIINRLFVRRDLETVFAFRREQLLKIFPPIDPSNQAATSSNTG